MKQTQRIRFQRNKKAVREATLKTAPRVEEGKKEAQHKPAKERLSIPTPMVGLKLT